MDHIFEYKPDLLIKAKNTPYHKLSAITEHLRGFSKNFNTTIENVLKPQRKVIVVRHQ